MLKLNSLDSNSNLMTLKVCQSPETKFCLVTLLEICNYPVQKLKKQNMLFTHNNALRRVC